MNTTNIEWTTFSANPLKYRRKSDGKVVWACVKTSPGCAHCYSEGITLRYQRGKLFNAKNMEELEPFLDEAELRKMLTAKTIGGVQVSGSRCFVGDMTDVFGEWVPDELLDRLFAVFALRSDVTWQVLTKRAERMQRYIESRGRASQGAAIEVGARSIGRTLEFQGRQLFDWPLPGVWLGVSVEDQKRADERWNAFRETPAAIKFVSYEPALGPVDWSGWEFINQLIVGGESGHGARPFDVQWARDSIAWCCKNSICQFIKQLGSQPYLDHSPPEAAKIAAKYGVGPLVAEFIKLRDKKGGDITEFPDDLMVREYPG